jgi:hypothetical protein
MNKELSNQFLKFPIWTTLYKSVTTTHICRHFTFCIFLQHLSPDHILNYEIINIRKWSRNNIIFCSQRYNLFITMSNTEQHADLLRFTHLEIWNMDNISILVFGDNSNDSRPATPHIITAVQHLTACWIHIGVRLQPSRQSSTTCPRDTVYKVFQEQSFIGVTTAT